MNSYMGNESDLQKIRSVIGNARREINRQKPGVAIRLLEKINEEIQSHEGTLEWADFSLALGEAFSAKRDARAENYFMEAQEKAARVPDLPVEWQIRLHEHLGDFYAKFPLKLSLAWSSYERAKKIAVEQHLEEDIARIELKIICVDLQRDKDPEIENFQTLRRVANGDATSEDANESFTWTEQLMALHLHIGNVAALKMHTQFARGFQKMTDAYFLELLKSTRDQQQ